MSRYIDADKLALKWMLASPEQKETFRQIIDEEPTADVVEVRHGYWKWEKKSEPQAQNRLYCSICDNECLSKGNYYVYSTYCPHCGAKMDGERREE
jgi:hypothetical protein